MAQLERVLSSGIFHHSRRYPALLRYIVEQTLRGATDQMKERVLGVAVFKRLPDYDTNADPVVRITATEVRKRLEDYYSDPGHAHELRIMLPIGAYVPEFRNAPQGDDDKPGVVVERAVPKWGGRRWRAWAVYVSLAAALAVGGTIVLASRQSALDRFWAPILQAPDPILAVTETWRTPRNQSSDLDDPSRVMREPIDAKLFLTLNEQSGKLASFLRSKGKQLEYALARNVSQAALRRKPFLLLGAFNNPLTLRLVSPLRFYFEIGPDHVRRILDRQNLSQRDWAAPLVPELTEDYALVAREPDPDTGQPMLVIAGLSDKGSAAALEFLTNPRYLARFAAGAPSGWYRRNIEFVIQTKIVDDEWCEPRIVAMQLW